MKQQIDFKKYAVVQSEGSNGFVSSLLSYEPFTRKISSQDKAKFCLELAVMLQARVSLHRSLQILSEQASHEKFQKVIRGVLSHVQKGGTFSQALSEYPDAFDNLFTVTAEVGQESGKLPQVMLNLAVYLEKLSALKRKFTQALAYPILVLSVAVSVVVFLLLFIVPTFSEMFRSLQIELPWTTKAVLTVSEWLTEQWIPLIISLLIAVILVRYMFTSSKMVQWTENLLFNLPLIGSIYTKNMVARFCRTLGTMLQAQVSLVNALEVTQRIFTVKVIQNEIREIIRHVRQGNTVSGPLVSSKVFPPMVSQMIAVGEETSELDAMLIKVAEYYEKDIDSTVETLSSTIEPILILFLGFIVAAILIAMYMPMFDLINILS